VNQARRGGEDGIRVGSAKDGKVVAFISEIASDANMPEGIAADSSGIIYGGWTSKMKKQSRNSARRWAALWLPAHCANISCVARVKSPTYRWAHVAEHVRISSLP
jgi:hypothetical protein